VEVPWLTVTTVAVYTVDVRLEKLEYVVGMKVRISVMLPLGPGTTVVSITLVTFELVLFEPELFRSRPTEQDVRIGFYF